MVRNIDTNEPAVEHDFLTNSSFDGVPMNLQLGLFHSDTPLNFMPLQPDEDEVVICSPQSFAEARQRTRRKRQVIEILDDDAPDYQGNNQGGYVERRTQMRVERRVFDLERDEMLQVPAPPPVPPPRTPVFTCPVCMGPIKEETSTKCGHIFCKECISTALAATGKCPTCRGKLRAKDTFRIYFPNCEP